jgi:hypothetical protein
VPGGVLRCVLRVRVFSCGCGAREGGKGCAANRQAATLALSTNGCAWQVQEAMQSFFKPSGPACIIVCAGDDGKPYLFEGDPTLTLPATLTQP